MADPPRQAADLRSSAQVSAGGGAAAGAQATPARRPVIPERYALREKDGARFLECDEAPRLRAIIDPEMSVSANEAAALGERVILLDGAGSFGPLLDNERQLYNLDHHAGCERLFTLSTCEQALLLVQSGLELSEGDWKIYANDPDLDTVLALWCLLNHRRVRELRPEARDVLLPLFRLEGAIDANGPELARLCGLPTELLERTGQTIDDLLVRERSLKQTGSWATKNVWAYTLEMLQAVDALAFTRDELGDTTRIEEVYGHVEIAPRRVAVACRDRGGIYTVEQRLKARWGDQLSIIALENQPGVFTLRRLTSVAGPQLGPAYEMLNRADPAVDGRPPGKRWGGSQEIGGSPRPQGTRLAPDELLELLARAYRTWSWWSRARQVGGALLLGLAFVLFVPLASVLLSLVPARMLPPGLIGACRLSLASLLAVGVAAVATRVLSQHRSWTFGWRLPANGQGLWLAPLALLGALPVGAWAAVRLGTAPAQLVAVLATGAFAVGAVELWFRGVVHGLLALDHPVQRPGGPWLLSRAAVTSALAYAAVVAVVGGATVVDQLSRLAPALVPSRFDVLAGTAVVAFLAGLALAVIRERSLSLLPGIGLQVLGVLAAAALLSATV